MEQPHFFIRLIYYTESQNCILCLNYIFNYLLQSLTLKSESIYRIIVPARHATKADGINLLKSIPGLLKRLQIWAQQEYSISDSVLGINS